MKSQMTTMNGKNGDLFDDTPIENLDENGDNLIEGSSSLKMMNQNNNASQSDINLYEKTK